ncbi:MAG: hypothetical protein AAGA08_19065 [Pseudomonadota bacterium]
MMDQNTFRTIVDIAKYAPSAHNTQPARWSLQDNGSILVSADLSRRLLVGDPEDRDLLIACGAAVEGTVLAMAQIGQGAQVQTVSAPAATGYRPMAVIVPTADANPEDIVLSKYVKQRLTHRLGFAPSSQPHDLTSLRHSCVTLVQDSDQIAWLSTEIDQASARIMRDPNFRAELLNWMRLSTRHARYHEDGLNKATLAMGRVTAWLTRPILGSPLYRFLSACGLGPTISGEAAKSRTSSAILLFHWPKNGKMIDAGRMFYRTWLNMTAIGLAGWPAAALADDDHTADQISTRFQLPRDHVLFNALRLGSTSVATPPNKRLTTTEVIIHSC